MVLLDCIFSELPILYCYLLLLPTIANTTVKREVFCACASHTVFQSHLFSSFVVVSEQPVIRCRRFGLSGSDFFIGQLCEGIFACKYSHMLVHFGFEFKVYGVHTYVRIHKYSLFNRTSVSKHSWFFPHVWTRCVHLFWRESFSTRGKRLSFGFSVNVVDSGLLLYSSLSGDATKTVK